MSLEQLIVTYSLKWFMAFMKSESSKFVSFYLFIYAMFDRFEKCMRILFGKLERKKPLKD